MAIKYTRTIRDLPTCIAVTGAISKHNAVYSCRMAVGGKWRCIMGYGSRIEIVVCGSYPRAIHDLAAHTLARRPSPKARGVLAAWPVEGLPRLLEAHALPPCGRPYPMSDGTLLCVEDDRTVAWDHDTQQVRFEVEGSENGRGDLQDVVPAPLRSVAATRNAGRVPR